MKKIALFLLLVLISLSTLTGCDKTQEVTPLLDQDTVIAAYSTQTLNVEQGFSESQKVTDEKVLINSAKFIDSFSGLPPFNNVSSIDKAWIVKKYFTQTGTSFYDKELYNKYNCDYFTKLTDIEKLAKQNINPNISMNQNDDFSSCDGSSILIPLWIKEKQAFGWKPSGGYSSISMGNVYPLETYEISGKYHIRAIDLHFSFEQDFFPDTNPKGTIFALMVDNANPNKYIEVGTFSLDEKTNKPSYNITKDLNSLKQYWYVLEPTKSNGYTLFSKQSANGIGEEKIKVTIDDNPVVFDISPIIQDDKLFIPFHQFAAEYSVKAHEIIKPNSIPLYKINGNEYCDIESALYNIGARIIYDDASNTHHIYSKTRIDKNAETVGSYLMDFVTKQKAVILYKPTLNINGEKKEFKVLSILGDGYLKIQNGKPVIVNAVERLNNFNLIPMNQSAKKNFASGKYVFGYFLDDKNHIVTDPVALSQLQTITIANWEYQVFRDGLILMDKHLVFWEKPKHFSGAALLDKWNDCIKTGYEAIEINKDVEPFLDFMESFAATVFEQTISPHTGITKLLAKATYDTVQSFAIGITVNVSMNKLTPKVRAADLVDSITNIEHDIFLSQTNRLKNIVEKTKNEYILTYEDAVVFLQGYYQLNATMKSVYISCMVYKELIPESRKSVEGALSNLVKNVAYDKVLDFSIIGAFNDYIDSEKVCSFIKDIAMGFVDSSSVDYNDDPINGFLSNMYQEIKNEKMKLNYALYNNVTDSMSYSIVSFKDGLKNLSDESNIIESTINEDIKNQKKSEELEAKIKAQAEANASNKEEYIQKLNNIEKGLADLENLYDGPTSEMVEAALETHKRWDNALNDIYGVLKKQLPANEMSLLKEKQIKWIKYRDDTAKTDSLQYRGGTLEPLEYRLSLANTTKERCYELVEIYMK